MYQFVLYEDGKFVSPVGGQFRSMLEAVGQISRLLAGETYKDIRGFVGCQWDRIDGKTCCLALVDEFGQWIKTLNEE